MNILQYLDGETDTRIVDQFQNQIRYSTVARLENGIPFKGETFKRHGFEYLQTLDGALRIEAFNISTNNNLSFIIVFYLGYITLYNTQTNQFNKDENGNIKKIVTEYNSGSVISELKFNTYQSSFYIYHKDYKTLIIAYVSANDLFLNTTISLSDQVSQTILNIWAKGNIVYYNIYNSQTRISNTESYVIFQYVKDESANNVTLEFPYSIGSYLEVKDNITSSAIVNETQHAFVPPADGFLVRGHTNIYFRITGKSFFLGEKIYLTTDVFLEIYAFENNNTGIGLAKLKHNLARDFVLQNNRNKNSTTSLRVYDGGWNNPNENIGITTRLNYYIYPTIYDGLVYQGLPQIRGGVSTISEFDFTKLFSLNFLKKTEFAHGKVLRQRHWGFSDLSVYGSAPNDFANYSITGNSGFAYDPSGGLAVKSVDTKLNSYYWIEEFKDTLLFGHPEKLVVSPKSPSVTNFSISTLFNYGCGDIQPIATEDNIFFVDREKTRIMSVLDNEYGQTKADDITEVSEHPFILQAGIKRIQYQRSYFPILWALDNLGSLFALVTLQMRWSRIITDGIIKSIAVISENKKDTLYLLIERIINGQTKIFLEKWLEQRNQSIDLKEQFYLDAGKYFYDTVQQSNFTISHLPNTDIKVLADGQDLIVRTDELGNFTLENPVNHLSVGLPYSMKIKSHSIEIAFNLFSSKFKFKRIADVIITVIKSFRGLILHYSNNGENQEYPRDINNSNVVDLPISDTIRITAGYRSRSQTDVTVEHTKPKQCIMTSIQVDMDVK